jgi:N-methylhydantoinase A
MVNIRLAAVRKRPKLRFPKLSRRSAAKPSGRRPVYLSDALKPVSCPIYQRSEIGAGTRIKGPALIEEHGTTTVLFEKDRCSVAPSGEIIIDVGGAHQAEEQKAGRRHARSHPQRATGRRQRDGC